MSDPETIGGLYDRLPANGQWVALPEYGVRVRRWPDDLNAQVSVQVDRTGTSCTVRVVHIPTGIVTTCSEFPGTVRNRDAAMAELRERLQAAPPDAGIDDEGAPDVD